MSAALSKLLPALAAALFLVPIGSAHAQGTRTLAGRWSVSMTVDSGTTAKGTATVSGNLVAVSVPGADPPTFRGSYQIPLSTIGLSPDAAPLLARVGRDDSIRIVLNPNVDHGHIEMVGALKPGAIEGRWTWIGRPTAAGGRFTLRPIAR